MNNAIHEYDVVRVRSLDGMRADAFGLGSRSPAIGELGTVVSMLSAEGHEDAYLVECVQTDATTAWIASFPRRSLDVVSAIDEISR